MEEIDQLENGKLVFHSYEALKTYCDNPDNPLDRVVLGKEITALNSEDENGGIKGLFEYSKRTNKQFNGIADWDVSKVKDMSLMFYVAKNFNQPIDNWDVSNVESMSGMFWGAKNFNQPIGNWDVSKVTNMYGMFKGAEKFNQLLEKWNVSKVKDMSCMLDGAKSFNQPIGNWDVSKVSNMYGMFYGAKNFNQPLDNWDLSNKPYGAEDLEQFRQSKAQGVEQKDGKIHHYKILQKILSKYRIFKD